MSIKATWLGQAGLLLEADGKRIMIDPYLSSSVEKYEPENRRRLPIDERFLHTRVDILIFTHDHLDHYDPETAPIILSQKERMTVLSPSSVYKKARANGNGHNYVLFDRYTEWSDGGVRFSAIKAQHSDPWAIGVVIEELASGEKFYITGDTLYSSEILKDLPSDIYAIFLPINGVGNNMNAADAARFADASGAKKCVPMHFGMFDDIDPCTFSCSADRVIPRPYEEIKLYREEKK